MDKEMVDIIVTLGNNLSWMETNLDLLQTAVEKSKQEYAKICKMIATENCSGLIQLELCRQYHKR